MKIVSIIENYIQYLAGSRYRSLKTIESYQNDLRQYCDFLNNPAGRQYPFETSGLLMLAEADLAVRFMEADFRTVQTFYEYLKTKFYAPSTVARKCTAVEGFYKYLQKTGHIKHNPFEKFKFTAPKTGGRLCLDDTQILKLLETIADKNWLGIRDKAVVALLYETGVKVGELLRLTMADYSAHERILQVHKPGGKSRTLKVSEQAALLLDDYIRLRRQKSEACNPSTQLLFLNRDCSPITVRSIRRKLKEYGKASGLSFPVTPEVLRRSHAVKMRRQGIELEQIARQMGYLSVTALKQQMELNESCPVREIT